MNRYRTLRTSMSATSLLLTLTCGAYAQGLSTPQFLSVQPTPSLTAFGDIPPEVPGFSAQSAILDWHNKSGAFGETPVLPPVQFASRDYRPTTRIQQIQLDSAPIEVHSQWVSFDSNRTRLGAKGDVFNGKVIGRDDGILLKGSINGWDHDLDPGIQWSGTSDSLRVIVAQLDSLIPQHGSLYIPEVGVAGGKQYGSLRIGDNGIITLDSVLTDGFVSGGDVFGNSSSNSVTIGPSGTIEIPGLNGQKHDHYYLKDGKRYYIQYADPGMNALKMEERVGKSNIWLIDQGTLPVTK